MMLLRTRATLMVALACLLLVAGLSFAAWQSQILTEETYAVPILASQRGLWEKLVEAQRLEVAAAVAPLAANGSLAQAVALHDAAQVQEAMSALAETLPPRRLDIVGNDGQVLYSSAGTQGGVALVDAGTIRGIVDANRSRMGMVEDAGKHFLATVSLPLATIDGVVGVATLATDLRQPLEAFKAATGADVFLVDLADHLADSTDPQLWELFDGKMTLRKSRLETWQDGDRFFSLVVLPLGETGGRVVTVQDSTATLARQRIIRLFAMAATGGFLVLVLAVFSSTMRRWFIPLEQAGAVLDALAAGEPAAAVTAETVEEGKATGEIGRFAGAVGVLRDRLIDVELSRERDERQRSRHKLFLRLQVVNMTDILEEDARRAVLSELASSEDDLEALVAAVQALSARIRYQHEQLAAQLCERGAEADDYADSVPMVEVAPLPLVEEDALVLEPLQPPAPIPVVPGMDVTIANDTAELGELTDAVDRFIDEHHLPGRMAFNLNVCLDELLSGIITYGYGDGERHDIRIGLRLEDGALITEIVDDAKEFNPFAPALDGEDSGGAGDRPIGGMGVFLVAGFVDSATYRRDAGRNIITLVKAVEES
jgi:sigma-B regulation protein RsbU (phosphoserine phosphatase)